MKLKPDARDELLIRIDERVKAIKDGDEGDIPEIKEHLKALNSRTNKQGKTLAKHAALISLLITILLATALKAFGVY